MRVKQESEKPGLKQSIKKNLRFKALGPITSWQTKEEKVEAVTNSAPNLGLQNHCGW